MREIKFRAIFEGRMIYFSLIDVYNNTITLDNSVLETIQQSTNLKDKNGKEIYENPELLK